MVELFKKLTTLDHVTSDCVTIEPTQRFIESRAQKRVERNFSKENTKSFRF
jgi:hypothetical protein